MPLVANRFAGHFPQGDPRTPVTVAGGCIWPTVPAMRYLLVSDDATGVWSFLNTDGILVEHQAFFPGHDKGQWNGPLNFVPITRALGLKEYEWPASIYTWCWDIQHVLCSSPIRFCVTRPYETCNRPIPLIEAWCLGSPLETTGTTFRMLQVEFDETKPPGGWPPE